VFKRIMTSLPGFRTGRTWKKIVASIGYPVLVLAIFSFIAGSSDSSVSSMDNTISKWESVTLIVFLIVLPFLLLTNAGKIRSLLPMFRSGGLAKKAVAWTLSMVIIFVGFGLTHSVISSKHSTKYKALQEVLSEEQAVQSAKAREKKEAEKQIKLAKEAEESAKKEAEQQAQLVKESEEKAAQASEEQAKKEAEEQVKLAKEKEKNAKKEADKQAKLAEKAAEAVALKEPEEKVKSTGGNSVTGWFGSLFSKSKTVDNKQKTLDKIDNILKKGNPEKIMEIYHSSDAPFKSYMEEHITEKYLGIIKDDKDLFIGKKMDKIKKLYDDLAFINEIANLKNSDVGIILAETKRLMDANAALADFNKKNPNLKYGIIKDISEVNHIDGYVSYRIKDADTKIGDFTIGSGGFSDSYFISSYSYSQLFGYSPTEDWEAVLLVSEKSNLSQEGVYKTDVVSIGTTTLIDSKGFKKEYPKFREVTGEDYDTYNHVNERLDKQNQLNHSINQSIKEITERLS